MPNIFEYATSELSQDAMIAWLMACAKADEDKALREVGQSFIRFLLETPCNGVESAVLDRDGKLARYDDHGLVSDVCVRTQYENIDVYCSATIDGKQVSFVIEDKTGTTEHSNQLERYKEIVQSDEIKEDYLKLIYLKTGMPFDWELRNVANDSYCHVGASHLEGFLNDKAVKAASSDLLDQFRAHISASAGWQHQAYLDWDMNFGQVQYRFAEALKARIEKANEGGVVWQGPNIGGGHWAQYRFSDHHLFWRMDTNRGHLRMMVEPGKTQANVDAHRYRDAFRKACEHEGQVPTWPRLKSSSREMSVGAIEYPYPNERKIGEDVDAFLNAIAQVHERFLQEVAKIRANKPA